MKAIVSGNGVLIPRRMLRGVKEVEIRQDGRTIVAQPAARESDPLFGLGEHPVRSGVADGAEHHDTHLYGGTTCRRIKKTLAFDKHFTQAGFERLP